MNTTSSVSNFDRGDEDFTVRFISVAVNPGVVDTRVIRHSPGQWRANQGTVRVSWKSGLFPSQGAENVLVEVMAFRVGQNKHVNVFSPLGDVVVNLGCMCVAGMC